MAASKALKRQSRVREGIIKTIYKSMAERFNQGLNTENLLQRLNLFRIILKLTVTPLRILFFIGHIISIGLTADRMPGIPQMVAFIIATLSESFEDFHYFIDHDDEHHHDHGSLISKLERYCKSAWVLMPATVTIWIFLHTFSRRSLFLYISWLLAGTA